MSYLFDTHAFLWWISDAPQLSDKAKHVVGDGASTVFVSVVTAWEIAIKRSIGKLDVPAPVATWVDHHLRANRFRLLPIELRHASRVAELPFHHRDPFDRLLVAQALEEQLALVTADRDLAAYGAPTLW